jgi:hypothetical protein
LSWREQPEIQCEWVIVPKPQPAYRLAYPQYQSFRSLYPKREFQLPAYGQTIDVSINGIRVNQVFNKLILYCQIAPRDRAYWEWLDLKPTIQSITLQCNEIPDLTSNIPQWLLYRYFRENCPQSLMSMDEWVNTQCMVVLSPSQLNVDAKTFTEGMARVSTFSVKAVVKMNRAYRQISANYNELNYPGRVSTHSIHGSDYSVKRPRFEFRASVLYDNSSLVVNSKSEMIVERNSVTTVAPTGLVRSDRGLPRTLGYSM